MLTISANPTKLISISLSKLQLHFKEHYAEKVIWFLVNCNEIQLMLIKGPVSWYHQHFERINV